MKLFNPNPKITLIPIPGHLPCVVIDDFLVNPQALVDGAGKLFGDFVMAPHNAFPGLEMRMPDAFSWQLSDFFMLHIRRLLTARRIISMYSRLSMVTLKNHQLSNFQRVCHRDKFSKDPMQCFGASVLYLFHDAQLGGTSFYLPKISDDAIARIYTPDSEWLSIPSETFTDLIGTPPKYQTTSNNVFELVCTVPAAWNRVIFYDGSIFHSAHITEPDLLTTDPTRGRLTLNGFFTCRKSL